MKKLSIFLSALAIVGISACKDDTTPVLNVPDSFSLNTPPTAEQYYELTPDGTIALTCSQPDYGFVATATYSAEISLDKENVYAVASNEPSSASFTINDADVATGICTLRGIESPDDWTDPGYQPLYIRAVAKLDNDGLGLVKSNWIELPHVKGYFAIPSPGFIYLVGACSEWNMTETETLRQWRLYENEKAIGSKIFSGVFEIPAGQALFRFYTELDGNWDTFSYGPANSHNGNAVESDGAYNVECKFTNGVFEDGVKATKDNFNFTEWEGGKMTIVVDMSKEDNYTVTITAGEHEVSVTNYAYMVGNNGGWAEPSGTAYDDWKLADKGATGVYTGTFQMPDDFGGDGDKLYCRFYSALNGWGPAEWSASADGSNVDAQNGIALPTVAGEGCFVLEGAAGNSVTVTLDTNNNEVTFTINEPVINYAYMVGNNGGWAEPTGTAYDDWKLADKGGKGVYTGTFRMPADFGGDGDKLYCRFYSALNGWGPADWSASADGSNVDAQSGVALPTMKGEGCYTLAGAAGHSVTVSLDANNNEVTFTIND